MTKKLTDEEKAAREAKRKKLENFERSTRNHQPGKHFKFDDGTTYRVSGTGAWIRTSGKKWEEHNNLNNNSVRRRMERA